MLPSGSGSSTWASLTQCGYRPKKTHCCLPRSTQNKQMLPYPVETSCGILAPISSSGSPFGAVGAVGTGKLRIELPALNGKLDPSGWPIHHCHSSSATHNIELISLMGQLSSPVACLASPCLLWNVLLNLVLTVLIWTQTHLFQTWIGLCLLSTAEKYPLLGLDYSVGRLSMIWPQASRAKKSIFKKEFDI